jgi:hypothetical protein
VGPQVLPGFFGLPAGVIRGMTGATSHCIRGTNSENIDLDQYCLRSKCSGVVRTWEEVPMRAFTLMILAMGIVLTAGHAQAQTYDPAYPVCLNVVSRGISPYYRCSFTTMDQCRASANGQMCSLNPYYSGANAPVRRNNRRYNPHVGSRSPGRAEARSYAPAGPPTRYRPAPYNQFNEPYFGASQGYAPGEKQQFLDSVRRFM